MAKSRARKLADIIVGAGIDIDGNLTFDGGSTSADLTFADGDKANFGDASDLQIYHDSSHSYIQDAGSGNLYLRTNGTAVVIDDGTNNLAAFNVSSGEAALYYGGSGKKLATTSTGVKVTGNLTADDNQSILLGTGSDLRIKHDGTDSIIADEGGGDLIFKAYDDFYFKQVTDDANILRLNTGGDATFYGHVSLDDDKQLKLGDSNELVIYHTASGNSIISEAGGGSLYLDGTNIYLRKSTTSGETMGAFVADGAATLYYDNSAKLATFSGGVSVTGQLNATTMHLPDGSTGLQLGASNDTKFFHDGSNSKITHSGSGGFYIGADTLGLQTGAHNENYLTAAANGAVSLYYDNSAKLATATGGITVTGETNTTSLASGNSTMTGLVQIGNSSGGTLLFKRPSANYIFADQTGGYLVFGTNGRSTSIANSNFYLGADQATTFVGEANFDDSISSDGPITINGSGTEDRYLKFALDGKSSAFTGENAAFIFCGQGGSGDFLAGGLYLQSRSATAGREIGFITGTTPAKRMVIDSSGNVGIDPSSGYTLTDKLTVRGSQSQLRIQDSSVDAKGVSLLYSNSNNYGQLICDHRGNNQLNFYYSALNHYFGRNTSSSYIYMTLTDTGELGLGTTSPFAKSHIVDTSWSSGAPYGTVQLIEGNNVNDNNWGHLVVTDTTTSAGNGGAISFAIGTSSALHPFAGIKGVSEGTSYGGIGLFTRASGGTATERMRIDSSGNVGIGTTAPITAIHAGTTGGNAYSSTITRGSNMKGGVFTQASNGDDMVGVYFATGSNTAGTHWSGITGSRSNNASHWGTQLNFYTHNNDVANLNDATQKMVIKGDGNVGIGTTSPDAKLQVAGTTMVGADDFGSYDSADGNLMVSNGSSATSILLYNDASAYHSSLINYHNAVLSLGLNNANTTNTIKTDTAINITATGVGIATTDPKNQLHVNGGGYFTGFTNPNGSGVAGLELGFDGTQSVLQSYHRGTSSYKGINMNAAHVAFNIGGVEKARVHSNGNVGIGTSSPTGKLEIAHNFASSTTDRLLYLNSSAGLSGGLASPVYGLYADIQGNNSATKIYGAYINAVPGTGDATYGLYAQSTQTASNKLSVAIYGKAETTSATTGQDPAGGDAVAGVYAKGSTTGTDFNSTVTALTAHNESTYGSINYGAYIKTEVPTTPASTKSIPLRVLYGSSDMLTIHAQNGETVFNDSSLDHDFRVESNNNATALYVDAGNDRTMFGRVDVSSGEDFCSIDAKPGTSGQVIRTGRDDNSTKNHLNFLNPNGTVGSIQTAGSATLFNTSSDQRLKENIVDAPSASDDIDAIQVRSFDWKVDGAHQKYGMVAQELQSVVPEAVSEGENEDDMMAVDYSKLVPMLVKEIQSLRARVAELEGE